VVLAAGGGEEGWGSRGGAKARRGPGAIWLKRLLSANSRSLTESDFPERRHSTATLASSSEPIVALCNVPISFAPEEEGACPGISLIQRGGSS
jgi:hypothetical protein